MKSKKEVKIFSKMTKFGRKQIFMKIIFKNQLPYSAQKNKLVLE